MRADLEAATRHPAEARLWYQRFLDLWSKADPELKPLLDRVRKSISP